MNKQPLPSLSDAALIAIDCETYDPNIKDLGPGGARGDGYVSGVSVTTDNGVRLYASIRHPNSENYAKAEVREWLNKELNGKQPKIGANILYDLEWLKCDLGVDIKNGPLYDVQFAEPLLDETRTSYSLNALAQKYTGEEKRTEHMAAVLAEKYDIKENEIGANIYRLPAKDVEAYAIGDTDLTLDVFRGQVPCLEEDGVWGLFELECGLIPMLLAMRLRGVRVDVLKAEQLHETLNKKFIEAKNHLDKLAGFEVDIMSAQSCAQMFDKYGEWYPKTKKTNAPSFTARWLETHPHEIGRGLREARRIDKLNKDFVQKMILEHHVDWHIFCQFHPLRSTDYGTVSGRFSSSNPNLQQVPKRDEEIAPMIRGLFIPGEDRDWWRFDWSQIEFRILVHYAFKRQFRGADKAREMYMSDPDTDFHTFAAELSGLDRKNYAKNFNFGKVYGMGINKLCGMCNCSKEEGYEKQRIYDDALPFVKLLFEDAMRTAQRRGHIRTVCGRKRKFELWEPRAYQKEMVDPLPHDEARDKWGPGIKRHKAYKALNALLQGSAADMMKVAMKKIWDDGICDVIGAPALTVHDELDGDVGRSKEEREALRELNHIMETCVKFEVPIYTEGEIGSSWGDLSAITETGWWK